MFSEFIFRTQEHNFEICRITKKKKAKNVYFIFAHEHAPIVFLFTEK